MSETQLEEFLTVNDIVAIFKRGPSYKRTIMRHWPRWATVYGVRVKRMNDLPGGELLFNKSDFIRMVNHGWAVIKTKDNERATRRFSRKRNADVGKPDDSQTTS